MSRVGCGDFFTVLRSSAVEKYYSDLDALRSFLLKFRRRRKEKVYSKQGEKLHTSHASGGMFPVQFSLFVRGTPKTLYSKNMPMRIKIALLLFVVLLY